MDERTKYLAPSRIDCNRYFWRTKDGTEIDYVEEVNDEIHACEFKWNLEAKTRFQNRLKKHIPTLLTFEKQFFLIH